MRRFSRRVRKPARIWLLTVWAIVCGIVCRSARGGLSAAVLCPDHMIAPLSSSSCASS